MRSARAKPWRRTSPRSTRAERLAFSRWCGAAWGECPTDPPRTAHDPIRSPSFVPRRTNHERCCHHRHSYGQTAQHRVPEGTVAPPRPSASGADLHDLRHPDPVPAHDRDLHAELEHPRARGQELPRLRPVRVVRRPFQLRHGVHRHPVAQRGGEHDRADHLGRRHQPADRVGTRGPAGPQVPRARSRPHLADRAVPGDAGRVGVGVEARAVQPRLRAAPRGAQLGVRSVRGRGAGDRLRVQHPDARDHRRARVAVDAVHDADPAGRAAVPARRRARGRQDRPRRRDPDLPLHHAAAPAAVHRAVRAARHDLRGADLRRDLHDHPGRTRVGDEQPALRDLPDDVPQVRVRRGRRGRCRGGDRHPRGGDLRAAHHLIAVHRGDVPMSVTQETSRNPFSPEDATVAQKRRRQRKVKDDTAASAGPGWAVLAWIVTLLFFAPVAWMVLTSLHSESDAATNPPSIFAPLTLSNYQAVFERGISSFLINSVTASVVSTLLVLLLAVPAAYALSIKPVEKWTDVMFFFLSTKFLPPIAALLPIYLIVKEAGMLDNVFTLVILYTSMNLPIAIWMMQSFLAEVPKEILEAAQVDGAGLTRTLLSIVAPIAMPGLAATSLICFIFSWNEFMFAVNLTATRASTAPIFLVGFISSQGLFLAKLCAAATLVSLPVLIAGFAAQDKLVRGLSLGAVK